MGGRQLSFQNPYKRPVSRATCAIRAFPDSMAGWIRAPQLGATGARLRQDLDRLILQGILPERARLLSPADPRSMESVLKSQWDEIKTKWEKQAGSGS